LFQGIKHFRLKSQVLKKKEREKERKKARKKERIGSKEHENTEA
jgi:hypothetical protein